VDRYAEHMLNICLLVRVIFSEIIGTNIPSFSPQELDLEHCHVKVSFLFGSKFLKLYRYLIPFHTPAFLVLDQATYGTLKA
jgi:hypothetical protein